MNYALFRHYRHTPISNQTVLIKLYFPPSALHHYFNLISLHQFLIRFLENFGKMFDIVGLHQSPFNPP